MAQLPLDSPDRIDGALGHSHRHAALQHHEGRPDAGDEGPGGIGDQLVGAHEMLGQAQGIGARALHAREAGAFAQLDPWGVTVQQEHDFMRLAGRV